MPPSETTPRIVQFVQRELLSPEDAQIQHDEDLLTGGHIDSMGIMRLIGFLESEFGITVPPEEVTIENFLNIETISNYVDRQTVGD